MRTFNSLRTFSLGIPARAQPRTILLVVAVVVAVDVQTLRQMLVLGYWSSENSIHSTFIVQTSTAEYSNFKSTYGSA